LSLFLKGSKHPVMKMLWWLQHQVQQDAQGDDRLVHFCFENDALKIQESGVLLAQASPLGKREKIACFMCGTSSIVSLTDGFYTLRKHFWRRYQPDQPKYYEGTAPGRLMAVVEERGEFGRHEMFGTDGGVFSGVKTGKMSPKNVPIQNLAFWVLGGGDAGGFDYQSMVARRCFASGEKMYAGRELVVWAQLAEREQVARKYALTQRAMKTVSVACQDLRGLMGLSQLHYGFINRLKDGTFSLEKATTARADKDMTVMLRQCSNLLGGERFSAISKLGLGDDDGVEVTKRERDDINAITACMPGLLDNPFDEDRKDELASTERKSPQPPSLAAV
jgi:hypothetical protein